LIRPSLSRFPIRRWARRRLPRPTHAAHPRSHLPGVRKHWRKLLDPLAIVDLAHIDVAARIGSDRVRKDHLAGQPALAAELSQRLAALSFDDPDDVVMRVGHEQILLLRVFGYHHLVRGAAEGS